MLSFEEYKNKLLQDPEFKKEWDALDPEFQEIRKANHEYQNDPDFHFINGQVVVAKDDEWWNETEWDDLYEKLAYNNNYVIN